MEYQLTAEIIPPADTPQLDALQRHGVAALLDDHLDALAGIDGPDGIEIDPVDHQVSVQSTGATVTWLLDAPALEFAEDAASHALKELLERTDALADWSVRRCEVTASDEDLAAALGEDDDGDDDLVDGDEPDTAEVDEEELADRRARLLEAADQLHAFGPDEFGHRTDDPASDITAEQAQLVAGALVRGLEVLTEELFADVLTLEDTGTAASEHDVLWVLDELPEQHAEQYTGLFAKKFLVTTAILGYRLSQPNWTPPLCTAEALALHLVKEKAEAVLEVAGALDELPFEQMISTFDEVAFEDLDHEWLYQVDPDLAQDDPELRQRLGNGGLAFTEWFYPYEHLAEALHPYLTGGSTEDDAEEDSEEAED